MAMNWIKIEEAARLLGVSPQTVRNYVKAGRLTKKEVWRTWYVYVPDVEELRTEKVG